MSKEHKNIKADKKKPAMSPKEKKAAKKAKKETKKTLKDFQVEDNINCICLGSAEGVIGCKVRPDQTCPLGYRHETESKNSRRPDP